MADKPTKRLIHYLKGAWYYQKKMDKLADEIKKLRSQAEKSTTSFQDVPVFGNFADHRQDMIADMVDKQQEYRKALQECNKRLAEIQLLIDNVEDYHQRIVLEFRYIYFDEWLDIAMRLNYSIQNVLKIHGKALVCLLGIHDKMVKNGRGLFK